MCEKESDRFFMSIYEGHGECETIFFLFVESSHVIFIIKYVKLKIDNHVVFYNNMF